LPVIITTAFGGPEAQAMALQHGASAYLDKPFPMARLVAALHRITSTSGGANADPA
jgi:DNA-binding response OmpR family regulator